MERIPIEPLRTLRYVTYLLIYLLN